MAENAQFNGMTAGGNNRLRNPGTLRNVALATALLIAATAQAALPDPVRFGTAMEVGDLRAAARWLAEGLDPDFEAHSLGTGLMIGAWEGNIAQMELFLGHGANINFVSRTGEQALLYAAWKGHANAVRWLVEHGAEVNRTGKQWTALHYATFAGHESIVRYLLERGADVNARTTNDSTALMLSAREGHEKLARLLLDVGADPRPANDWGDTAFTWAMGHRNLRIARLLSTALDALPPDTPAPPTFAEAVKAPPETFPAPVGSVPAPPEIAKILEQLRTAELNGKPTRALRQSLHDAIARFKADAPPALAATRRGNTAATNSPKALVVTARRGEAGRERAELVFGRDGAATPPQPGDMSEILARIRQAEAQGKPLGELRQALRDAVEQFKREGASRPAP